MVRVLPYDVWKMAKSAASIRPSLLRSACFYVLPSGVVVVDLELPRCRVVALDTAIAATAPSLIGSRERSCLAIVRVRAVADLLVADLATSS